MGVEGGLIRGADRDTIRSASVRQLGVGRKSVIRET
jgi:hypothetical protein